MRHVPVTDLQTNAAELTAAIDAGEEVVITLHGRAYKLVESPHGVEPDDDATVKHRVQALADLQVFRAELRDKGVRVTREEVREWINEGRR